MNTSSEFDSVIVKCKDLFLAKLNDYGASWRILRLSSLTDQIYIKANRIRTIEDSGVKMVDEGIETEFIGIVNYSIIALIQIELGISTENNHLESTKASELFDKYVRVAKDLMERKNHDYGESWRYMRVSSMTDLILVKIMRLKEIENHHGKVSVSEGIEANYLDIINYAVFALIKLGVIELEK
jgi:hypothetical protein